MSEPYLEEYEKKRIIDCIANIKDKLDAIQSEVQKDKAYKYYIEEKIQSVLWDSKCIKSYVVDEGEEQ